MKRFFALLSSIMMFVPLVPVHAASLAPGNLIKASGQAVYYYAQDGKRYVFPTEKIYMSWYADFSGVVTVTDTELANIAIGGNVTYRPGVRLVKITTDPRVYAVHGQALRWIASEAAARQIFGDDWARQVDDIPDPFFVNYTMGADIDDVADYAPSDIRTTYNAIQTTLASGTPTPNPTLPTTPTSTPPTIDTPAAISLVITTDRATAQINESIFVSVQTTSTVSIDTLELYADDGLLNTCRIASCTGTWSVPSAGVKSSYTFRAKLVTTDSRIVETTTSVAIVTTPVHASIQVTADRATIRPTQNPNIRVLINAGLVSTSTQILIDGISMKVCASTPGDCRYTDYLSGDVGTTHQISAVVTTPAGLQYKSNAFTISIADNDTPMITLASGISTVLAGQTVEITATAQDDDGIGQTRILKDGQVLKTCLGAIPCTIITGPWNVAAGTVLTFEARVTDLLNAEGTAFTTVSVQ